MIEESNKILCQICQRYCKDLVSLSSHLKQHKISAKDYYDRYLKKDQFNGKCLLCQNKTSFYNLKRGYLNYCSRKCMSNHKVIRNKIENTCIDRYGTRSTFENEKIKQKSKNSLIDKFGVDNISKVEKIKEIKKETLLNNYGVENPSKSKIIQNKKIKTSLLRYGTKNPNQSNIIKQRLKETFFKKYGVDHWTKTNYGKYISRLLFTSRLERQRKQGYQNTIIMGKYESACLDELEKICHPYSILRCPLINGYYPDGYIKELNLIIEYDENHHFMNEIVINKDLIRECELKKYLNCYFFRIKHNQWKLNKNEIIENFKRMLKELNGNTT